jgi:hypothetical protein
MGIEPTSEAWEASILPLYDARSPVDPVIIIHNDPRRSLSTYRYFLSPLHWTYFPRMP